MRTKLAILVSALLLCPAVRSQTAAPFADRFKQLDKNGDGKVSAEEFPGAQFNQMDKDNDGFATMREAHEFLALRREGHARRGVEQPAAPPVTDSVVELPKSSPDTWFRLAFEVTTPGCQAAAVFDVNNDNMQDIVVAGWDAYHILAGRLDGNRELHFASDTRHVELVAADVDRRGGKIAALGLHDLNHDGRLDLYLCRSALGGGTRGADDPLLNLGAGRFERVDLGIASLGVIRSALFSDFDGDGHFDVYYTCSPYNDQQPNQLHAGTERWDRFGPDIFRETLVNPSVCFDEKGRANKGFKGAVVRDFDGDGKPDIVAGAVADTGMIKVQAGWERGLFLFHNVSSPGRIRFEEVANTAVERAHSDGTQYPQMHVYSVIAADMLVSARSGAQQRFNNLKTNQAHKLTFNQPETPR